ncbi:phosphatidate cytidylyltransferase [Candidatus Mesenet endosymbiont of Phosphuga atrata]|uniref:phosphatidate cytidylyltransferase n=1 Tax=Candidatus Mesenet endosymbiont of Phosphuga atrata TaxID=3066221 RepID=UPI0030CC47B9
MISNNLVTRVLSSIVMLVIVLLALYFGNLSFYLLILSIAVLSAFEWHEVTKGKKRLYPLGLIAIALPNASLIYLYNLQNGIILLLWLVFSIWSIDTGAYFVGKSLGGWKICPMISPNKTWSGLAGAILASIAVSCLTSIFFRLFTIPHSLIIGFVIAIVAQLGDFTESAIKRICGVKDTSNIIPGHGGLLDRVDGFIFTAPLVAIYLKNFSSLL